MASGINPALPDKKKPLPVPPGARLRHTEIIALLRRQYNAFDASCLAPDFIARWESICALFERYQQDIMSKAGLSKTCAKECDTCCGHWVDDVHSFEAEIIAAILRRDFADHIPGIIATCKRDSEILEELKGLVENRLSGIDSAEIDDVLPADLLLAVFYQMRRPCPLLYKGSCLVYAFRPLTCRMYVSFSPKDNCDPDLINEVETPTYLFNVDDQAHALLGSLHDRYLKFKGVNGLRSLLVLYLS